MPLILASRAACICLLAAMLAACSASRDDLIGDFQIDYGYAVETLRLSKDGNYTQLVRLKDESSWTTRSGRWELNDTPRQEVVLYDAMAIDDGSGKLRTDWQKPVSGPRILPVKDRLGTVSLIADERRGLAMIKLPPPPVSDKKPNIIHLPPKSDVEVQ